MEKIDENNTYVAMATDPDGNPIPLKVDTVTGRLLIAIVDGEGTPGAVTVKIDENDTYVGLVTNNADTPYPLITDSNGSLWIDIQ